ncbi:MATE family efflux transporter [Mycoplasmatota bacterium]|nr:MATE family efflux transporter [Mycoplasmatota bacterium]
MEQGSHQLKNMPIKKLLWKLSIPAIIGMTFNALYNIVDAIFVGEARGESGIAAISIVSPVQMIVMAIALTIGIGAASIYSRAIGAEDSEKARKTVNNAFVLGLTFGIIISIIGLLFGEEIAYLFGMKDDFKLDTMNYLEVIFYGITFQIISMIYNNLFRAEGFAKTAMVAMIVGTSTNIILDPIFIFDWGLGLGTRGAAYATVIGYTLTFGYLLYHQFKSKGNLRLKIKLMKINLKISIETIIVGIPAFVRNSIGAVIIILINNLLKQYSIDPTTSIALYGIISRTLIFVLLPIFGIVQGMSPIVGYNFGSEQYERSLEATYYSKKITYTYFLIVFILIQTSAKFIVNLFGVSQETIILGSNYLRLTLLFLPLLAVQIILTGYYQALGKSKQAAFIALLRQSILLVPLVLILPIFLGEIGIWIAIPLSDLISSLVSFWLYRKEMKSFRIQYLENLEPITQL